MKKITLILALTIAALTFRGQQLKYYITDQGGQPWGSMSNVTAMDLAFGAGNWTQAFFQTVNVNTLLQSSVCLIYCDGGSMAAAPMNNFLVANMTAIQNWVFNGGRLFLNAAPNTGNNMNYGHGGCTLNYVSGGGPYSSPGAAVNNAHPIFVGPLAIASFTHQDNFFDHGYVTGAGLTPIINNTYTPWTVWGGAAPPIPGYMILGSKPWGSGMCLFGSMTNSSFHTPAPSATNLRANMLTWLAVCCVQPTITAAANPATICPGQSATLTASGAGVGGTYTWTPPAPGVTVVGQSAVFSPTATTIYTVAGTNSVNCNGTTTVQITVSPLPTITAVSNPTGVCLGQTSATITMGGGVTYTTQPGNYPGPSVVVSPVAPVIYTVSGSNALGCVNSATVQVGINPATTVAVNNPTACAGSPLNLAAGGGTAYVWAGPGGFNSNIQNPVIAVAQGTNTGPYTCTVTNAFGCKATGTANAVVTVVPPALISSNAIPGGICFGKTLSLTGNGGGGPATYVWTGPNSFSAAAIQTPTIGNVSLAANGVYSLVTTVNTCTVLATTTIVVHALPTPVLMSNSPVCLLRSITFTATGGISYTLTGPNGYTSNNPNANIPVANNVSAGPYTVTVSDVNGCVNKATTTVVINALPIISAVGSSVCAKQVISLTASGGTAYTWSGPNAFASTSPSITLSNAAPNMGGVYTVTVTDINGCTSASVTNVSVYALPNPTAVANTPLCAGKDIKLFGGDPLAVGYLWQGPNGYYSIQQNPVIGLAETNMSGIYTITATDPNGCVGKSTTVVLINSLPTANVTSSKNKGCVPICVNFNVQSTMSLQGISWQVNDQGSIGTGLTASDCFKNPGTYLVRASFSDMNGCTNRSMPFEVNAYPIPMADFNYAPFKPVVNEDIQLSDASHEATIKEWSWNFTEQANNVSLLQNPQITYENAGAYPIALIVKSDKGCSDTIVKSIIVGEDFSIFVPNTFTPNGDGINEIFQPKGFGIVKYELNIFTRWGEKVFTSTDFATGWDGTKKGKDMSQEGTYVWKIQVTNVFGKSKELTGTVSLLK